MGKVLPALLTAALVVTYKVYDKEHNLVEVWKDKGDIIEVYDREMAQKGFIKKEHGQWSRYDKTWKRESTIEKGDKGPINLDWKE